MSIPETNNTANIPHLAIVYPQDTAIRRQTILEHSYTDYLFILAIHSDGMLLDTLLYQMETGGDYDDEARALALDTLKEMEQKGLVRLYRHDSQDYVRLTAFGTRASDHLAQEMEEEMISQSRLLIK